MTRPLYLIVDDEPAFRSYLRRLFQHRGIEVLEAETAVGALRILQKLGSTIDLLITDIQMPGEMDGVDLGYSVKNMFPSIPVILVSGIAEAPTGFSCVRKPFTTAEILSAIDKVMIRTTEVRGEL